MGLFKDDKKNKVIAPKPKVDYAKRIKHIDNYAKNVSDYIYEMQDKIDRKTEILKGEITQIDAEMQKVRREIDALKHLTMNLLVSMQSFAKKEHVKKLLELAKDIDVSRYVTRDQVEKFVEIKR